MAVAPEVLEGAEGAAAGAQESAAAATRPGGGWQALSQTSGHLRRVPAAARAAFGPVSSPSATAQTITKLIWAVAVGLIVLEVAAQATGQTWSFSLPGTSGKPRKGGYLPLYAGQQSPAAAALPGVLGPLVVQSPATNLSGRAGGNLAVG